MKYYVTSILSQNQNLELPPDIDPKDPNLKFRYRSRKPLSLEIIQKLFIHLNSDEFFDCVERVVLEKFIADIEFILDKHWANEISTSDFCFGHICGESKTPLFEMDKIFSLENIAMLYHTHSPPPLPLRIPPLKPEHKNSNILSSLITQPIVVYPNYEFGRYPFYVVGETDLGLMHYATLNFEKKSDGPYELKNGTKFDVWGFLLKDWYRDFL